MTLSSTAPTEGVNSNGTLTARSAVSEKNCARWNGRRRVCFGSATSPFFISV